MGTTRNYISGLPLKFVKSPLTAYQNINIGADADGFDVTFYGDTSGAYTKWDASEATLTLTASDLVFSGASGTHHINFDAATLSHSLIGCGSYSSPMDQSTTTGFASFNSTSDDADSWRYGMALYTKATGAGTKLFGLGMQQEYNGTGGVDRLQCISAIAFLGGGGEAARLKTLGGDASAGMYCAWFKLAASGTAVIDSGSRMASVWLDSQIGAVSNGEHYAAFITTGGDPPDAVFGFEASGAGWSNLFYFDETCYDQDPISSLACDTNGGDSSGSIKFSLNGSTKYIPYFDSAS